MPRMWMRCITVAVAGVVLMVTAALADTATVQRNSNLRGAASTSAPIIRLLHPGESLDVISQTVSHGYLNVRTQASEEGWVWKRNVTVVASSGGGGSTGSPADAIDPGWDKPEPNVSQMGSCGPYGNDGDTLTNRRKNRTDIPADYHPVTFDAIATLTFPQPAPKSRENWSQSELDAIKPYEGVAVSVTGYLYKVAPETGGTGEKTNCNETAPDLVDWHIALLKQAGLPQSSAIVVEVTPRIRRDHSGWTTTALQPWVRLHANDHQPVRLSGWLMLDPDHPQHIGVYRCTLWEVHPVTKIEVFDGSQWVVP